MTNSATITPLMLDADQLAAALNIRKTLLYSQLSSGGIGVVGVRIGRRRLFSRVEVESWIAAGAPPRDKWILMKEMQK